MLGIAELPEPLPLLEISDVETLRIVAEQTRLAILRVLMTGAEFAPPVMSAKELAASLEQPQTKLYRHLKQLEEAGLIQVAETRLVSGIVEHRYRAAQRNIVMSPRMLSDPTTRAAASEGVVVAFNDTRDELVAHLQAGRVPLDRQRAILSTTGVRIPRDKADELRARLAAVLEEFAAAASPDGVDAHLFVAWYETGR